MAMERMRQRFSQDPSYFFDETKMNLTASESNPSGRAGHIPGHPPGSWYVNRAECSKARVHGKTVAGIHGSKDNGAYSICISGGYEDDYDRGDFIVYTGTGGQFDTSFGGGRAQREDQSFTHPDNAALAKNVETGRPVRVIRGPVPKGHEARVYAPSSGYRYDGLYKVTKAYLAKGRSGFQICRYELERLPNQVPLKEIIRNSP
ncbi:hypothetical protein D9611_008923 [Ephemerocybe angulata]|uniref:YDG domain-containing protein n=1 Tax=Ephemerocybe angulata TaxID=980116 RepID=A0A8H5FCI7_9AGAR|nr:hypothetical protein D9611_008923 [Tulosesus angulatus]